MIMDHDNKHIPMKEIDADEEFNCRGDIATIDVVDLAKDIKAKGLLQPVMVMEYTPSDSNVKPGKKYRLIGGFRRYTAHIVNQAETIWCTVMKHMGEKEATIMNLSENMHRQNLTIMQEARAIKKLVELGCGRHEIAEYVGMSSGWVQMRTYLLKLPKQVQIEVDIGAIKQGDIRDLYSIFSTAGEKACLDNVKKLKEAREKGVKASIKPKKKTEKRLRKKHDINEMLTHIYDAIGPCLGTRCLAWCGGEIDDGELFKSIKEEAEIIGVSNYEPPW
jgi:ParB family chromosome partitioning protein